MNKEQEFKPFDSKLTSVSPKYVIIMVGLPARGKSFISSKLERFLSWSGIAARVFNVGNCRRQLSDHHDSNFFDSTNLESKVLREQCALSVLGDALAWLENENGQIAIHDATNSTVERRLKLNNIIAQHKGIECFFIESICNDQTILEKNMRMKLKGPDYINTDADVALADFRERVRNYEKVYEPIGTQEEDLSYIKVIDFGKTVIAHRLQGYLPGQCVHFIIQIHTKEKCIWLVKSHLT